MTSLFPIYWFFPYKKYHKTILCHKLLLCFQYVLRRNFQEQNCGSEGRRVPKDLHLHFQTAELELNTEPPRILLQSCSLASKSNRGLLGRRPEWWQLFPKAPGNDWKGLRKPQHSYSLQPSLLSAS